MNDYTTKTASLLAAKIKGTKADVTYLNIDGTPFSKVVTDNVPENPTTNDIWKYAVTTDDEGVVTITDDVTVDYTEVTDAQKDILKTAIKVIDNKVLGENDTLLMNWDTKNFTNENNSDTTNTEDMLNIFGGTNEQKAPITEWNSDLSSLTNGMGMFVNTALESFSGDLSSLTNGSGMFGLIPLQSFSGDLPSLTNGYGMFMFSTSLTSFIGDMPSLINGERMFMMSESLTSFSGDLSSLTNGGMMFYHTALTSFNGDMPNLTNGIVMFALSESLTSFNGDLSSLTNGGMMFYGTALESFSGNLSSLTNGTKMFSHTPLESFSGDLSSLTDGNRMIVATALQSFSGDLSSLINGDCMFTDSALESFSGDLSSLTNGNMMFYKTALQSFSGDLSSLTNGSGMFYNTALQSFSGDLSSLINGDSMFQRNQPRHYEIKHYKMVNGTKNSVTETVVSNGLKSFISNLSSLKNGHCMFGGGSDITYTYTDDDGNEETETTKDVAPLDEESIMIIADTINDISSLDKTVDSNWTYTTYDTDGNLTTRTISSDYRGVLHLGYDSSITDTTNIDAYCDEIANKGWTVYLNGTSQVANNGAIETIPLTDENNSPIVIPHYYKPVQVTDEEIAEYVDDNGNYYIIVGAQHIFGDDLSTYGMFTSYQHAVSEITTGLGLTKYEKPSTENSNKLKTLTITNFS